MAGEKDPPASSPPHHVTGASDDTAFISTLHDGAFQDSNSQLPSSCSLNVNAQEFIPIYPSHFVPIENPPLNAPLHRHSSLDSVNTPSAPPLAPLDKQTSLPSALPELQISPPTTSVPSLQRFDSGNESPDEAKVEKFNANDPKFADVKAAMLKQVEFYFSDQNLPTDLHLLKLVKRNPDGLVPLKAIAGFNKIKYLVPKDVNPTAAVPLMSSAIKGSTLLALSKNGKSVRRINSLPEINIEDVMSCTVVAENLPVDHSIEAMEKLFGTVGKVNLVRICQPDSVNGSNSLAAKHNKSDLIVSNKLHALVEYSSVEEAKKAVSFLGNSSGDWRNGLKVRLLTRSTTNNNTSNRNTPPTQKTKKSHPAHGGHNEENEKNSHDKQHQHGHDKQHQHGHDKQQHVHDKQHAHDKHQHGHDKHHAHEKHIHEKHSTDAYHHPHHHHSPGGLSDGEDGSGGHRGTSNTRIPAGRGRGRGKGHYSPNHGPLSVTPPRIAAISPVGSLETHVKLPPGPRMPDGTRGFTFGRGKKLNSQFIMQSTT